MGAILGSGAAAPSSGARGPEQCEIVRKGLEMALFLSFALLRNSFEFVFGVRTSCVPLSRAM
jgi:hypothetical protein